MTGLASVNVLGAPFRNIVCDEQTQTGAKRVSLTEFAAFSRIGNHAMVSLNVSDCGGGVAGKKRTECLLKVSPVVERKTSDIKVASVSHFAIEVEAVTEASAPGGREQRIRESTIQESNLSVGVMG